MNTKDDEKKPLDDTTKSSLLHKTDGHSEAKTKVHRNKTTTTLILLAIAIVVGIVRYKISTNLNLDNISGNTNEYIDETLKSMLSIESRVSINKDLNVAVGFGSCLDITVKAKDLIFDENKAPDELVHKNSIRNQEDLNKLLAYFFAGGAAAERYIDNRTFFQELVEKASRIEDSRYMVGGNAPVMAKRFILEGIDKVLLATHHTKKSVGYFHDKLILSGPRVDTDDVHICIEYSAGEKWDNLVAPRANRLIIHSDYYNPALQSIDNFIERLDGTKNLDLLVIGGLQLMDNIPISIEQRHRKLSKLGNIVARLPRNKPKIHLEMASFTEQALLKSINNLILPHVDSIGFNEQELPTLLKFLTNEGVNIISEPYPRVATTLDQMRQLYQILHPATRGKISRLHAHTLAFQAIMTNVNSDWKNTLTSSVKAALTAHRYTCGSHEIDMAKAKLIMDESYTTSKQGSRRKIPFNPKHPVNCWEENIVVDNTPPGQTGKQVSTNMETIEICVAPVLVCTKVKQTAGAGDNISASGLIFQL